jgi:hypothetical protein
MSARDNGLHATRSIRKSIRAVALMGFCAVSWAAGTALVAAPVAASTCIPYGGTCPPDDFSGQANGTLFNSSTDPFLNAAFDGSYTNAVYEESGGTLDFYYQVTLASDSTDGITDIVASGFQNALADMGYRSDGGSLGGYLVNGSVVPTSVTRGASGDSIDWDVVGLNPGDTSTVLEVHTNATDYAHGTVEITNGGNTVEEFAFVPVVTTISSSATPTTAQVGATLQDSATLVATSPPDGSGSITWDLYGPGDTTCATSPVYTQTITDITTDGPFSTTTGYVATAPGTYNWVASFSADLSNPAGSTYCGEEPVVITQPTLVPQITSASTTCRQYSGGTAPSVSSALYSVAHGKIKAVTPSGFSYFAPITSTGGTQTFTVIQLSDETTRPLLLGSDSRVLTSGCRIIAGGVRQSGATVTVTFNGGTVGETFYIDLKFKTSHVVGERVPSPNTTVRYIFNSGAAQPELDLVK